MKSSWPKIYPKQVYFLVSPQAASTQAFKITEFKYIKRRINLTAELVLQRSSYASLKPAHLNIRSLVPPPALWRWQ